MLKRLHTNRRFYEFTSTGAFYGLLNQLEVNFVIISYLDIIYLFIIFLYINKIQFSTILENFIINILSDLFKFFNRADLW